MLRGIVRLLALVLVVAGAVRVGVNVAGEGLPGEGSADVGFARDMRVHHSQAVEMAELVRDRTQDEDLRALASDIALTQQAQIGQMRGWLDTWDLPPTSTDPPMAWASGHGDHEGGMPGSASEREMDQLRAATGDDAEVLFLRLMIRHHEGGVTMAVLATEAVDRPEVRTLARTIVESQQTEIRYLGGLLAARHAEPLPGILPEDLSELGGDLAGDHGDGAEDLAGALGRWWLVGVAALALLFLVREGFRRPTRKEPAPAPATAEAGRKRTRRAEGVLAGITIDAGESPLATVAAASDEQPERDSDRPQRDDWDDWDDDRLDDSDRFPTDDSSFDDV